MTVTLPIAELLTELLTIRRLARFFRVHRNKVPAILARIKGVQKVDGFYRVPVLSMPPSYWLERGLLIPGTFQSDARICTNLPNRSRPSKTKGVR